jgi:hypothetical protein
MTSDTTESTRSRVPQTSSKTAASHLCGMKSVSSIDATAALTSAVCSFGPVAMLVGPLWVGEVGRQLGEYCLVLVRREPCSHIRRVFARLVLPGASGHCYTWTQRSPARATGEVARST